MHNATAMQSVDFVELAARKILLTFLAFSGVAYISPKSCTKFEAWANAYETRKSL